MPDSDAPPPNDPLLLAWLAPFVASHGGVAGTVHLRRGDELVMSAAHNIPEPVRRITAVVPRGKGMAGLAFEQDRAISSCNIQTDTSGQVRPGAKAVGAQAAVAIPVHDAAGAVRAVVGIAFMREGEIPDDELARLRAAAEQAPVAG
jgi:L-methionine (R)-S-oxide reductase